MNFNRRNFIRSASFMAALSLRELNAMAALKEISSNGSDVSEDDEAYWKNVRQLFPLSRDFIYLNNGTLGPSPYPVIDAAKSGMMEADEFGKYGGYETTTERLAAFVHAHPNEIALTHNVTEGINIACWGLPLKRRDEVIMTTHEHVGNALPWLNRQKLHGIVIKTFTPAPTAMETLNRIEDCITPKTRAIAIPHVPCTQGQVMPVKEITQLCKARGIFVFIDGAHGPGMLPLNLHDIGCDAYASCCHKWMLGPKGTGFLYVRKDFQRTLQTYFIAAGGSTSWDVTNYPATMGRYEPSAHRYYGGTQSSGLYMGVTASIDFIETIGLMNIHRRIKSLSKYAQDQLLALGDKIEMLTPVEERSRCAVTGFRIKNVAYDKFQAVCENNSIRIRAVPENGLNSLRVSTHIYNSRQEIDKLMEVVIKA